MVARFEWFLVSTASGCVFDCQWLSDPSVFRKLEEGTMMCLQPFTKELPEREVRTFFNAKGKVDRNLSGLDSIYGLATKLQNVEIPKDGIDIQQHPECFLPKRIGKELDSEHEKSARKMLQHFLIESRFPGFPSSGKDLVFRVDTFKLEEKICINEIDVWPIAMEFLDDLYQDDKKLKAFAKVLALFVQHNWFSWPL